MGGLSTQVNLVPYRTIVAPAATTVSTEVGILPSATPEPIVYTVVAGDSLSVIAFRFGVELNALILANPGVNANAMSIGMKLIIPSPGSVNGSAPGSLSSLPTPVINSIKAPDCHPLGTEQWICFLLVQNPLDETVGNITGQVKMAGTSTVYAATNPLDVIPAGAVIPLIAWIPEGEINPAAVSGNLTAANTVDQANPRYVIVDITRHSETYPADRRSVIIDGVLTPSAAGILRVLAYAQDTRGHVLGYRLWAPSTLVGSGLEQSFQIHLYSLGGAIAEVHLLAQITLE